MRKWAIAAVAALGAGSLIGGDIITGTGPGAAAHVKVFDGTTGALEGSFLPFGAGYTGGITVAGGETNVGPPGFTNIIVGAGPGAPGGHVKVFDGATFAEIRSLLAFPGFAGGVSVSGGALSVASFDILVGAGPGAPGGHVKVFSGATGAEVRSFLAFPGFNGGVTVASGHLGGPFSDLDFVVGAGPGAPGGHVKVFESTTGAEIRSFFAFPGFNGGVSVASANIDGVGFFDIIVGAGPGAPGGHVKVFSGDTGAEIRSFFAFPGYSGGVRVASAFVDGDGLADIIVSTAPGPAGGHVKVFSGATGAEIRSFLAYPGFNGGAFVGGRF